MATVVKIDSNITGLAYAEEASLKTLPGTPVWVPLEPNSYADFGGNLTLLARNPINPSRQRKKGVVTDLDASGGFDSDFTQTNLQGLLQGFMFADLRRRMNCARAGNEVTAVTAGTNTYTCNNAAGHATAVLPVTVASHGRALIFAKGFTNAANNGLKHLTSKTPTTAVVAETLVTETPPAGASIVHVGHEANGTDDYSIDVSGAWPALVSTGGGTDFTVDIVAGSGQGLLPGEWIHIGGDSAAFQFAAGSGANNGWKRIRSVAAHRIEFDKSSTTMVIDAGTGKTIQLFFSNALLKNELGTLVKRRTYNLERQLGASDDAAPTQIQSEYLTGAVANQLQFNIGAATKLTCDLSFVAADFEQRTGVTGVKTGTRNPLVESDAFNTSSDFSRIRMAVFSNTSPVANATPLFAYVTDLTITINNNVTPLKAVGVLGSFDSATGTFEVGGNLTAYFADIAAVIAVRNNSDVTLDILIVKANAGVFIDFPLIALGDGRANVEQDQPIKLPLSMNAATAVKLNANMDYTVMFGWFEYLPNAADL